MPERCRHTECLGEVATLLPIQGGYESETAGAGSRQSIISPRADQGSVVKPAFLILALCLCCTHPHTPHAQYTHPQRQLTVLTLTCLGLRFSPRQSALGVASRVNYLVNSLHGTPSFSK